MANEIRLKDVAESSFTITMDATTLADGACRASTAVTNSSDYPAAIISVRVYSNTAPEEGSCYTVYLLRDLGTLATDGWAGSDATHVPENAPVLGTIVVTNDSTKYFYGEFDTAPLGPLGPSFGIAILNSTGENHNSSGGAAYYNFYLPEIQ